MINLNVLKFVRGILKCCVINMEGVASLIYDTSPKHYVAV